MIKELPNGSFFDVRYSLKNVCVSFLMTAILLFFSAIAVTYLSASETVIDALVFVITAVCVLWGGFRASRHLGRQGLLSGAVSGLLYMAMLYLIGSLIFGEISFSPQIGLSILIGAGCGAIGGIVGVNTRRRRR